MLMSTPPLSLDALLEQARPDPQAIADGVAWVLTQPPHVNVSDITIRPIGQDYP